ncbi:hypothetical protein QUC31_000991 [Theobroma cacao]|uniref:Transmembrane protein n=1 Tax=Theobroma cacao TaxID=3641 RepID=A0A061FP65_THECC|nr:Uncharacterized protein TCM_035136 [Theobroma cacao]
MENNQSSIDLGSESKQGVGHSTIIQAAIGSLVVILLTTIQVLYQNDDKSPFKAHALIMKIFIVFAFTYTSLTVAVIALQSHCTSYLPLLNHIGFVLGALVCDFLLLILLPPFGYFVLLLCILMLLIILLKSYQQIFKLLRSVATLASNRAGDLLHNIYGCTCAMCLRIQLSLPRSTIGSGDQGHLDYDLELNEATN